MSAHVELRERGASHRVFFGDVGGVEAVIKFGGAGAHWNDPCSPFFGGVCLVPPFVPAVHHEAAAWARFCPARVLQHGVLHDRAYVALRRVQGAPLRPWGRKRVGDLLRSLVAAVLPLHRAGVVHRDLRPANILDDGGRLSIVDLDLALIDGLGCPGPVGSRRWAAPELTLGAGDARADLFAIGRLAHWSVTGDLRRCLPRRCAHRALIEALTAPEPHQRPQSISDVARALGMEVDPVALGQAHPSLLPWEDQLWLDRELLLWGSACSLVDDLRSASVWTLRAAAGRLLLVAAQRGGAAWGLLASLCGMIAARATPAEADQLRLQRQHAQRMASPGEPSVRIERVVQRAAARLLCAPDHEAAWTVLLCALVQGPRRQVVPALVRLLAPGSSRVAQDVAAFSLRRGHAALSAELLQASPGHSSALRAAAIRALLGSLTPDATRSLTLAEPMDPKGWVLRGMHAAQEGDLARFYQHMRTAQALASIYPDLSIDCPIPDGQDAVVRWL